jgi:hypothetical protein
MCQAKQKEQKNAKENAPSQNLGWTATRIHALIVIRLNCAPRGRLMHHLTTSCQSDAPVVLMIAERSIDN